MPFEKDLSDPQSPQSSLDSLVPSAISTISSFLLEEDPDNPLDPKTRLAAAQDILDRTGFAKKTIVESQVVALPPATLEAAIRGLGALFQLEITPGSLAPQTPPIRNVSPPPPSSPSSSQQDPTSAALNAIKAEQDAAIPLAKKKQQSLANRPLPAGLLSKIQGVTR